MSDTFVTRTIVDETSDVIDESIILYIRNNYTNTSANYLLAILLIYAEFEIDGVHDTVFEYISGESELDKGRLQELIASYIIGNAKSTIASTAGIKLDNDVGLIDVYNILDGITTILVADGIDIISEILNNDDIDDRSKVIRLLAIYGTMTESKLETLVLGDTTIFVTLMSKMVNIQDDDYDELDSTVVGDAPSTPSLKETILTLNKLFPNYTTLGEELLDNGVPPRMLFEIYFSYIDYSKPFDHVVRDVFSLLMISSSEDTNVLAVYESYGPSIFDNLKDITSAFEQIKQYLQEYVSIDIKTSG